MAMQIGGAATSAIGAYGTASANRIALNSQANIAEINARIASTVGEYNAGISERKAQTALKQGEREQQRSRLGTAQLKSSQRAAMAANGIDLGSDTATNILTGTDVMGEIDADTIRQNAVMSAWGYRAEGANARIQSSIQAGNLTVDASQRRGAANAINPFMSATSSLLGSAGGVAQSWYSMGQNTSQDLSAFRDMGGYRKGQGGR
jgi:hypothetical protein